MKNNQIVREFGRYLLVGGTAFAVDMVLLYFTKNFVFYHFAQKGVYYATAVGFIGGLIYNYFLSLFFVFESAKTKNKGKSLGAFMLFAMIGVAGLLITELGMYVGIEVMSLHYLFVKIIVAGLVFVWNFGIRKILIFQ